MEREETVMDAESRGREGGGGVRKQRQDREKRQKGGKKQISLFSDTDIERYVASR